MKPVDHNESKITESINPDQPSDFKATQGIKQEGDAGSAEAHTQSEEKVRDDKMPTNDVDEKPIEEQ